MRPEITVVVPAYNAAGTLPRCLEAVRASTFLSYELLVVDDGSADDTVRIARRWADRVIRHRRNLGHVRAHHHAMTRALGSIVVNVDADVIVPPDALEKVSLFFSARPEVHALTAPVAAETPAPGFFSDFKNLYIHFRLKACRGPVDFLYGSFFALRREAWKPFEPVVRVTYDTQLGQELARRGKKIIVSDEIEVTHLKRYTLAGWMKNDFGVAWNWARLFLFFSGGGRKRAARFAHAPASQILSLFLVPLAIVAGAWGLTGQGAAGAVAIAAAGGWLAFHAEFFRFIHSRRGGAFLAGAMAATFVDYAVMAAGAAAGVMSFRRRRIGPVEDEPYEILEPEAADA